MANDYAAFHARHAIAIEEMPDEFVAASREPVDDPELAALDHLLGE